MTFQDRFKNKVSNNWILNEVVESLLQPIDLQCKFCGQILVLKQAKHFNNSTKCSCIKSLEKKKNKFSKQEFSQLLLDYNHSLLSEYISLYNNPIQIKCNNCNSIKTLNHASSFIKHPTCKQCNYQGNGFSLKEFLDKLNQNGFRLLSEIKILSTECSVEIQCINCGKNKKLKQFKNALKSRCVNRECSNKRSFKYSLKEAKQICLHNNVEFASDEFKSIIDIYNFKCKNGHEFSKSFAEILRSFKKNFNGCKQCAYSSMRESIDLIKSKYNQFGLEFLDTEYFSRHTKYNTKCLKCNFKWTPTASSILNIHSGCPQCNKHLNEKLTGKYLHQLFPTIKIWSHKYIKRGKTHIYVDYYMEINNEKYIVEYNGIQHYQPTIFSGNKDSELNFEKQKNRDQWLRDYCITNNINLIEIDGRYYIKENILEYLKLQF